jgi:beta-glucosidase/6-phospho-beta-glucosidase/beta-galactosidase
MQHLVLVLRRGYIDNVCQAANDGVKVKGYYAWSLME